MSFAPRTSNTHLGSFLGVSLVWHAALVAVIVALTSRAPVISPPIYRVDLMAAPPGARAEGVVSPTPAPQKPNVTTPPAPPPPPPPPVTAPSVKHVPAPPVKAPQKVTPAPQPPATKQPPKTAAATPTQTSAAAPKTAAPVAGGGPNGGNGADVANVHTSGVEFPYPAYLNNIVRQVALNFSPDDPNKQLRAEVTFLIKRDGTVTGFRFVTRSGDYSFDLEAQGAIEKAKKNFGPLPTGFTDDVLPVVFSFDPRLLR